MCLTTAVSLNPANAAINFLAGNNNQDLISELAHLDQNPYKAVYSVNKSTLSELLNTEFRVRSAGSKRTKLRLVKVIDSISSSEDEAQDTGTRESFLVVFRGSRRAPLKQETYILEHQTIGRFALFLVPASETDRELRYEAIFNRL